jgi:hypothetical protein
MEHNLNPAIESACATRALLEDNCHLLAHATNNRLEELLNAILEVLDSRGVEVTVEDRCFAKMQKVQELGRIYDEYEDELYRKSLEAMAEKRMASPNRFSPLSTKG